MTAPIGLPPQPSQTLFSGKTLTKAQKREKQRQEQKQAITQQVKQELDTVSKNTQATQNLAESISEIAIGKKAPDRDAYIKAAIEGGKKQIEKQKAMDSVVLQKHIQDILEKNGTFSEEEIKDYKRALTKSAMHNAHNFTDQKNNIYEALGNVEYLKAIQGTKQNDFNALAFASSPEIGLLPNPFKTEYQDSDKGIQATTNQSPSTNQPQKAEEEEVPTDTTNESPSTSQSQEVKATSAATPTNSTTEADKADTPKAETKENEKKEDEGGGILQGWKKTKLISGAALLAGGIALKMTLIGIVPGLIMAGVGAALMGWAGINWAMGGKKDGDQTDDNKEKKADAPATENK